MLKQQFSKYRVASNRTLIALVLLLQVWAVSADSSTSASQATQEWVAKQEIAELQRRYAQATDMIAADRTANEAQVLSIYLQIFTEDAEMGVLNKLTLKGPVKWLEMVKESFAPLHGAQHMIGTQVVEIQSLADQTGRGGVATMRSYLQATHVNADGTIEPTLGTYLATAIYLPDSGWRLSKMTLELL